MLKVLREKLANGPFDTSILAIGASQQLVLKVRIHEVDELGMVCQIKGLLGGWGDMQLRPWASVGQVNLT